MFSPAELRNSWVVHGHEDDGDELLELVKTLNPKVMATLAMKMAAGLHPAVAIQTPKFLVGFFEASKFPDGAHGALGRVFAYRHGTAAEIQMRESLREYGEKILTLEPMN
jgi:hypothetical protein